MSTCVTACHGNRRDPAGTDVKLHVHVLTALLPLPSLCCNRPCRRVHRLHCMHPSGLLNPHLTSEYVNL